MTGMNYEYEDSQASEDKRQSTTPRPYTRLGCYNSGSASALWQAWVWLQGNNTENESSL